MRIDEYDGHEFLRSGAMFSVDDIYRYKLWRYWEGSGGGPLVALMMNPSTADAERLDPTVRKVVGYAKRWGHGGLEVLNVFPFRATDPKVMVAEAERGTDIEDALHNHEVILSTVTGRRLLLAFGVHHYTIHTIHKWKETGFLDRIRRLAKEVVCLQKTKDGWPAHPLYLKSELKPQPWEAP